MSLLSSYISVCEYNFDDDVFSCYCSCFSHCLFLSRLTYLPVVGTTVQYYVVPVAVVPVVVVVVVELGKLRMISDM